MESVDGDVRLKVGLDTKDTKSDITSLLKNIESVIKNLSSSLNKSLSAINTSLTSINNQVARLVSSSGNVNQNLKITSNITENAAKSTETVTNALEHTTAAQSTLTSKTQETKNVLQQIPDTIEQQSSKFLSLKNAVQNSADKLDLAKTKLEEFTSTPINPSEQFVKLQEQIDTSKTKLNALIEKKDEWADIGFEGTGPFENLKNQIEQLHIHIEELTVQMQKLKETEMQTATDSTKYRQLSNTVTRAERDYELAITRLKEYMTVQEQANVKEEQSASAVQRVTSAISDMASKTNSVFSSLFSKIKQVFTSLTSRSKSSAKSASKSFTSLNSVLKKGIMTVLKYGLGIRSLYILISKFRTAVVSGFGNLAQYSEKVNKDISAISSALAKFKNAIATAFQPILSVVSPILTSFVNKLSDAMYAVAQFFATLSGQSYVYKALDVQKDYAESLGDTASAADNASDALKDYLSPLDEVNKYSSQDTSATSSEVAFDTVTVDTAFSELANNIKEYFTDIFKPMQKAWKKYGKSTMSAWKTALDNVYQLVIDIGETFKDVWADGGGEETVGNILKLLQLIADVISSIAKSFKKAWNDNNKGYNYIQSILDIFNSILNVILNIGNSLLTVWSNGTGERIIGHIFDIFTNINNTISSIADNFSKAWTKNNTGTEIVQRIADIFEKMLGTVVDITEKISEWASDIDFSPLLTSLDNLLIPLDGIADSVKEGIGWAWTNVFQPLATWTVEKAIPVFFNDLGVAFELIKQVGDKVGEYLADIWNNFLSPVASFVGDAAIQFFETLGQTIKDIANNETAVSVLAGVAVAIGLIILAVKGYNAAMAIAAVLTVIVENIFLLVVIAIIAVIVEVIVYWDDLCKIWDKFIELWDNGMEDIRTWTKEVLDKIPIIGGVVSTLINGFFDLFEGLMRTLGGLITFLTGVFTGDWEKAWSGLGDIVGGVFDIIWGIVKTAINLIIDALNILWTVVYEVVAGIANGLGAISGAVGSLFGQDWSFSMSWDPPLIPKLAQGAVIPPNKEFLAVLGDQTSGTNIETPENLLRSIIKDELANITANSGSYRFTAQINRRTLFDEFINEAKLRQMQTGKSPFDLS